MAKTIHIETYGCQMNDYESDRTFRLFRDNYGYSWEENPQAADLVIFNTCSIREKADQKAFSSLGRLRKAKEKNPEMVIALGGCMAQARKDELSQRVPFVDIVFGTHQWSQLPSLVEKARQKNQTLFETEFYGWREYRFLPYQTSTAPHPVSELVTIQNGCNKFCTFCLVPFTRGREFSRPPVEILDEISSLAEAGVKDVTLLGQNVNAYGEDRTGMMQFPQLLRKIEAIDGIERIRFVTSHPSNLTEELVEEMGRNRKIANHLHLPLQSGSNRILKKMSRDYTLEMYRKKIDWLKSARPGIAISTDIIIGFPTETEEDFQQTMLALEEFRFVDSYSFCFSPRPHTKAARWVDDFVHEEIARERLARYQSRQLEIKKERMGEWLGRTVQVLVDKHSKRKSGRLCGKTSECWTVNFSGDESLVGQMVEIEVQEALKHTLRGRMKTMPLKEWKPLECHP